MFQAKNLKQTSVGNPALAKRIVILPVAWIDRCHPYTPVIILSHGSSHAYALPPQSLLESERAVEEEGSLTLL